MMPQRRDITTAATKTTVVTKTEEPSNFWSQVTPESSITANSMALKYLKRVISKMENKISSAVSTKSRQANLLTKNHRR
jgi:hypothetical protein